jgi:hypothetical protein
MVVVAVVLDVSSGPVVVRMGVVHVHVQYRVDAARLVPEGGERARVELATDDYVGC